MIYMFDCMFTMLFANNDCCLSWSASPYDTHLFIFYYWIALKSDKLTVGIKERIIACATTLLAMHTCNSKYETVFYTDFFNFSIHADLC